MNARRGVVHAGVLVAALWFLVGASPALAVTTVVNQVRGAWGKIDTIDGRAGGKGINVAVTFPTTGGGSVTVNTTTNAITGNWSVDVPANAVKGGGVSVMTADGCTGNGRVAVALPPSRADHAVLASSTATIGGQDFLLSGGYAIQETGYDNDDSSPTFGQLDLVIQPDELELFANGTGGSAQLFLDSPLAFSVDLSDVVLGLSNSTNFAFPVAGSLAFESGPAGNFSGQAIGTSVYGADREESHFIQLDLQTSFGPMTAQIETDGFTTTIPEPSTVLLAGAALLRWRQRRKPLD